MKSSFSHSEINQLLQSGDIKQAEKRAGRNLTHSTTDLNVALMGEILLASRRYAETVELIDEFFSRNGITTREVSLHLKKNLFPRSSYDCRRCGRPGANALGCVENGR